MNAPTAISMRRVHVRRGAKTLLRDVDWVVRPGEHWVVLGPNGSGKTTLLRVASTYLGPTSGELTVLGEVRGQVDVRTLRPRIGYVSQALTASMNRNTVVQELVAMGSTGKLYLMHDALSPDELGRADRMLGLVECDGLQGRTFADLSAGEKQRVLVARALVAEPDLLLLDEPSAGLDVAGRELLLRALEQLAARSDAPAIVFVTHHPEEVPSNFTHALALREGHVLRQGRVQDVLTSATMSACFGIEVVLEHRHGRHYLRLPAPAATEG